MDGAVGPETVKSLLRLLPPSLAEQVLASLDPSDAQRLRAYLSDLGTSPATATAEPTTALRTFFDMMRIAARPAPTATPGEVRRSLPPGADDSAAEPMETLKKLDAVLLLRALEEE